ncbi:MULTISPECIES: YicC/YloC family endoribonuclease [unclassified Comamonas]|uniref:YicC family protein n=1 Tax=Comamonas squillarum TaxID=2977320 RepID=A0ABY6A629_9BURK|nr:MULTISPECIES: YicC/YloC family endoribonuclease [unclassified Comamonas]PWB16071.1 YicC family protein [Comamonas sp. JNW]UXC20429.1 YicC family protein [Comamonas sp. PR12]
MPVYSMTGYASVQQSIPPDGDNNAPSLWRVGLEIRSVNSRFLDLSFKLPEDLRSCEPQLRSLVDNSLKRGKVEVRVLINSEQASSVPVASPRLLQQLGSFQDTVKAWMPTAQPFTVAEVLRLSGSGSIELPENWADNVAALCQQALKTLLDARQREGKRLADMLQDRIKQLRQLAEQAEPLIPELVKQQKQRFLERWQEAMALSAGSVSPEAAQDRALTEATSFAIRIDVAEELTRMRSHLEEISRLLTKGGDIGKRLDFLIQELHREANTLGSKSAALDLTRISVDMKVLIEQMREQVQNIE